MRVVEDADPYISHQYGGERVGVGVLDDPFSYYTNLPDKFQFIVEIDFVLTPHQSPSVTASPQGEAFYSHYYRGDAPQSLLLEEKVANGILMSFDG